MEQKERGETLEEWAYLEKMYVSKMVSPSGGWGDLVGISMRGGMFSSAIYTLTCNWISCNVLLRVPFYDLAQLLVILVFDMKY